MKPTTYISEVQTELKKVKWPTKQQATQMTAIVIIASLIVGAYIGALDLLFTNLLGLIVK